MITNQARGAERETIDARHSQISAGVRRSDAATEEDRDAFGNVLTIGRGKGAANEIDRVRHFVRRSEAATSRRADSPDWLVGEDNFRDIFGRDFGKTAEELIAEDIFGFTEGALSFGFTEEKNRGDLVADGGSDGGADVFVAGVEELAAFGMAN